MTTPTQYRVKSTTPNYNNPKILQVMKYRVQTTSNGHDNGHTYQSARAALKVYNNIRNLYRRLGYTIADAGNGHNFRAELWIKEGREDRNIEIYAM